MPYLPSGDLWVQPLNGSVVCPSYTYGSQIICVITHYFPIE